MNEEEIKEFLKQRREKQQDKDRLDDFMKTCKESDFNQDLKSEAFWTDEQKIMWLYSDRNSECFYCGIATSKYCVQKNGKLFACTTCGMSLKK